MGLAHSSSHGSSEDLSLPLSDYTELEEEYNASIARGDAKITTFKRLERAYRIKTSEAERLFGFENRSVAVTSVSFSRHASPSVSPASPYRNQPMITYENHRNYARSPVPHTMPAISSPRSPSSPVHLPSSATKLRPRPQSSSDRNPNRIDREKRSQSPRRSHAVQPCLKMSFEILWNIAWVSVSARLHLDPLPIADFPDAESSPVIENNFELVLLIYLLRSVSREFEGQARFKLRLLSQKLSLSAGNSSSAIQSIQSQPNKSIGPMVQNCGGVSTMSTLQPASPYKSIHEQSLFATVRLMDECHRFLDTFFASVAPRNGSWRDETDAILRSQLQKQETGDTASLIGSTCTIAFHIVRSVEFVVVGTKPSPPGHHFEGANRGPGARLPNPNLTLNQNSP